MFQQSPWQTESHARSTSADALLPSNRNKTSNKEAAPDFKVCMLQVYIAPSLHRTVKSNTQKAKAHLTTTKFPLFFRSSSLLPSLNRSSTTATCLEYRSATTTSWASQGHGGNATHRRHLASHRDNNTAQANALAKLSQPFFVVSAACPFFSWLHHIPLLWHHLWWTKWARSGAKMF